MDYKLACRLGELSHNEMRVVVFLHAWYQENRNSDPSRNDICQQAGIEKGNLSKAIAGLEKKGWIEEQKDKTFHLFEAHKIKPKVVEVTTLETEEVVETTTEKVVDLTTKVVEVTTKVVNPTTLEGEKVVKVTTKSCESYNSPPHTPQKESLNNKQNTERAELLSAAVKIPDDFAVTPEMETWAKSHKKVSILSDLETPTDKFKRHYKLATGKNSVSSNWEIVWELWMIREAEHEIKQQGANNGTNRNGSDHGNGAGGKARGKSGNQSDQEQQRDNPESTRKHKRLNYNSQI